MNSTVAMNVRPPESSHVPLAVRLLVVLALSMLFFAVWQPYLAATIHWSARELRVLPAFSAFTLSALMALCIQSCAPSTRFLTAAGIVFAILAMVCSNFRVDDSLSPHPHSYQQRAKVELESDHKTPEPIVSLQRTFPMLEWSCFAATLLSCVLLGSRLGRELTQPAHFLAFLFCAIAGNAWLAQMGSHSVGESTFDMVRLTWPPYGAGRLAITLLELVMISALLESARGLNLHLVSLVLGSTAGYCGGAFLALEPWPNWPYMPAIMSGVGALIAAWPDLKPRWRDTLKAALCGAALLMMLCGLTLVRRQLVPETSPDGMPIRYRGTV